jgi:hypothetical protein
MPICTTFRHIEDCANAWQEFPLIDEMKPDELVRIQMASYLIAVDFQFSMSSKRFSGARFAPLSPADEHHA